MHVSVHAWNECADYMLRHSYVVIGHIFLYTFLETCIYMLFIPRHMTVLHGMSFILASYFFVLAIAQLGKQNGRGKKILYDLILAYSFADCLYKFNRLHSLHQRSNVYNEKAS